MFTTEYLIFIEMQKTGGSHIALLLSKLFEGEQIGKHNQVRPQDLDSGKVVVSSIRNPWDWYLSLWTYGVESKGGLYARLTKRDVLSAIVKAMNHPRKHLSSLYHELSKDIYTWRYLYRDSEDVFLFRSWLHEIHNPSNSLDLSPHYGGTAIAEFCGFMTFRFLQLCCTDIDQLDNQHLVPSYECLVEWEKEHCHVDHFVRQESLETSLCEILDRVQTLSVEQRELIFQAKRTNISNRPLDISDYYDNAAIELVSHKERLLIDKFGYIPPIPRLDCS